MRASRKVFGAFLAVGLTVVGAWSTAESQTFQHPGVLVSRAQLDYVKIMVAAHTEPFYSAFLKAQNSNIGSLTYQPFGPPSDGFIKCGPTSNPNIGCSNADNDSSAAYLQALLWYITGNQQYANNAITLLNLYGHNLKGYSTGSTYSNAPLQAAWDGEKWPRAAEIIRYSNAGWADSDITAFKNMLNTAILPRIINGSTSNGNWEISMIEALIGIGVFNDDPTTFNTGVTYWKQRIPAYFYYHTDGGQPVPAPRGTADWYGQTVYNASVDGISQETCRDFGHAQYGISGALDAAETAFIQGVDLYNDVASNARNRLTAALEFNAYYLMGNPVPSYICGGTVTLQVYPTDEIGYNEYHNRLGIDLPLTFQYLQNTIRQLSNPTEYHIMVYETLSHGGDASSLQPFLMRTPASSAPLRAGDSTTFTINVVPGSDPAPSVSFDVAGLPSGVTSSFSPTTVTGAGATTLTLFASGGATLGIYPITVTGTGATSTFSLPLNSLLTRPLPTTPSTLRPPPSPTSPAIPRISPSPSRRPATIWGTLPLA
jgi:Alginate lyase